MYYNFILLVILFTALHCLILELKDIKNVAYINMAGFVLVTTLLLYIGLRPIHGVFVDMTTYAYSFSRFKDGNPLNVTEDKGFYAFMDFCAQNLNIEIFFFLCACIYIIPLVVFSVRIFGELWFYAFAMLVAAFTFWAYGTNGIRNGMATSIFLMGISFYDKKLIMAAIMFLALSFHKTTTLPLAALLLTMVYANPKHYIFGWFGSIVLSLAFGGFWENFFAGLGFADDRTSYLTDKADPSEFSSTGFRWDFLLYSFTGVLAGWYFIFKTRFQDKFYDRLYCMYLVANSFWILVIRANFSNRFSYLSWFMLGPVIIYPLLKADLVKNQSRWVGGILFSFYFFSYFFHFILGR